MKKYPLIFSVAAMLAVSPLFGQSVDDIIFQDDFSTSESNGNPSLAIWGTNVSSPTSTVGKSIKVTDQNSAEYFGQANNGYLRLSHIMDGNNGSLYIQANNKLTTPTTVLTMAFDFYVPSTTSWEAANNFADPRFRLGISGAFSSNNSRVTNELRFYPIVNGVNSVVNSENPDQSQNANFYTKDAAHSAVFVYNNSLDTITYNNSDLTLASSRYDLWINGVRVIAGGGSDSALLATGTALTTVGFGSFAGGSEMFFDNLVVYNGAWAVPEPSTYALITGALVFAVAWLQCRRRRAAC